MMPVIERLGIRVNSNEAYFDTAAAESYKNKNNRLMKNYKAQ